MVKPAMLFRSAAVLAGILAGLTAYVAVTLDGALGRWVERNGGIAVVDWQLEVLIEVLAVLVALVLGGTAVAVPALRLARRGGRPGIASSIALAAGVVLIGVPPLLWWRFDAVLAYEAAKHEAQAGAYGWWYYPALTAGAALIAGCVLAAVALGRTAPGGFWRPSQHSR
jgi:hypothetical protein